MAETALKGNKVPTNGALPEVGAPAPAFQGLVRANLSEAQLSDFAGKKKVINVFPSIDTSVCATSVRTFNEKASGMDGVVVLNVSKDLPFALKRFCAAEGLEGVETLSAFRSEMPKRWGVELTGGPMAGLCARAVFVLDDDDVVRHAQLVPEITEEPDYDAALAVI